MFNPMFVWMREWMNALSSKQVEAGGERCLLDCVEKMQQCLDTFDEYGTIPDEDLENLEFKLMVYNREKYAQEDEG